MTSWIELEGAVNVRDLAGLPTADGRVVQPGRLIRSADLQTLSDDDVRLLVDELQVRSVADLRSGVEVDSEGPGPLHEVDDVEIVHLSLFPEAGRTTDVAATTDDDGPVVLPWQTEERAEVMAKRGASAVYLGYLESRADSIVGALRLIAGSDGATIVHCAAGKDRTGTVIAIALSEVGVTDEAIVADYVATAERIEAILARLSASKTYTGDAHLADPKLHTPRAETMRNLLATAQEEFGGFPAWLRTQGWTDDDAAALRHKLLDP